MGFHAYLNKIMGKLITSLLLLSVSVGQSQIEKKSQRLSFQTVENFIATTPRTLQYLAALYKNWQQAIAEQRPAEKIQQMQSRLASNLIYNDGFFAQISTELPERLDAYQENLEFYDDKSIELILWFVQFLKSLGWEDFHSQIDSTIGERYLPGVSYDSLLVIRGRQIDFYVKLRQAAEAVPEKFRRDSMDRFQSYDEPPTPEGGFARLQKALSERLMNQQFEFEGVISIKAYIATDGEILRAQIAQSSGIVELDSLALIAVKDSNWRAAKYDGKPYKTDVVVPLRVWKKSHPGRGFRGG